MNRIVLALVALALTTTVFAGCLGGDDLESSVPEAIVVVTQAGGDDTFHFDGSASKGLGLQFNWSFGDGTHSEEPKVTHTYSYGSGVYSAALTITDANGLTHRWRDDITVGTGQNAPPVASFTPSARLLQVGEPLTVDASATFDPDGDPIRYEWDFNFPLRLQGYYDFREAKTAASGENGSDTDKSQSVPTPQGLMTFIRETFLGKHEPGASEPPPSMFNGLRSSTEPVFTLEEGFPEPTWFYVKLTAIDIKGASERIISEDMWAVDVVESKASPFYSDSRAGTFDFGAPAMVTQDLPEGDIPFQYSDVWEFQIPGPLKNLGRNLDDSPTGGGAIPSMYINLTWNDDGLIDELSNEVQMRITTPSGQVRDPTGSNGRTSLSFAGTEDVGIGFWTVELWARSGLDIEYTVEYWAMIDLNPFREGEEGMA